jgi:hypothetical protein
MSKRAQAISVMNAHPDKPMAAVVTLIADTINVTEANARSYYRYIVAHKLAGGSVDTTTKAKAAPKAKLTKTTAKAKVTKQVPATKLLHELMPESEVAKIKAANLARLKAVSARKDYKNVARPSTSTGVPDFEPNAARAEVETVYESLGSFVAPKFLNKDQLKALI